jgi:hypothetical protein
VVAAVETLVLGFVTWLVGIPILLIVIVAYVAYARGKQAKGEVAPADTDDRTRPPVDRDRTWDPHERYEDGEPPAAR